MLRSRPILCRKKVDLLIFRMRRIGKPAEKPIYQFMTDEELQVRIEPVAAVM